MSAYTNINMCYGSNNPVQPISPSEIDRIRDRLLQNINDLNGNKHRLRPDDFNQLMNYHQYAMNILDNFKLIQKAEMYDPYNKNLRDVVGSREQTLGIDTINPYDGKMQIVYGRDGRAKIKSQNDNHFVAEWEKQFDEGIMNPPSYIMPPSNVFNPQK